MSLSSEQGMLVVSRDGKTGAVVVSVVKSQDEIAPVVQSLKK